MTAHRCETCIVCSGKMTKKVSNYSFQCETCGYWSSNLTPDLQSESLGSNYDADEINISHLEPVRVINFKKILNNITTGFDSNSIEVLDVGCGPGLFLKMAADKGLNISGVEPNKKMVELASKIDGVTVFEGLFPECIPENLKYDVIIFNDVFEHIEELTPVLNSVKLFLRPNGKLIINIPNSNGFIFKLSSILSAFRYKNIWDRLWQTMFYTPHLHFFNPVNLENYLTSSGFQVKEEAVYLDTVSVTGLWQRLNIDKSTTKLQKIIQYSAVFILSPLLKILPADSFFLVAEPK